MFLALAGRVLTTGAPGKSWFWLCWPKGEDPGWTPKSSGPLSRTICRAFIFAAEKEMATHSSFLAWRILWMEEPGGLLSMGSHRVGHDWSDLACIGEGSCNPLQYSCLENPRDRGAGGLPSIRSQRVRHNWSDLAAGASYLLLYQIVVLGHPWHGRWKGTFWYLHMKERQSSRSQSRPLVLKGQVETKELLLLNEQIEKKKKLVSGRS